MKNYALLLTLLLCSTTIWALNPSRTYKQRPEKYNMKYSQHKVKTTDGAVLKAWSFPCTSKKTTRLILIAHNGEGNMGDYLRRVTQFSTTHNVVIFDYRGYGESSKFEIDNNQYIYPHFQDDYQAMINFCKKQFVATFDVYGWGIGAGLSLGIGYNRAEVRKIIADTPFLSMEDLEERFSSWEKPMKIPASGYPKEYQPIHALANPPVGKGKKVQLIIGSNDKLFKKADMQKLLDLQKAVVQKNIFVVENPDRKDNFKVSKMAYFQTVSKFLEGK